jgi:hypothetical protein
MQASRGVSVADAQFTKSALTFYIEAARHALNCPTIHGLLMPSAHHFRLPERSGPVLESVSGSRCVYRIFEVTLYLSGN